MTATEWKPTMPESAGIRKWVKGPFKVWHATVAREHSFHRALCGDEIHFETVIWAARDRTGISEDESLCPGCVQAAPMVDYIDDD